MLSHECLKSLSGEAGLVNQQFCSEAFVALATRQLNESAQLHEALFALPPPVVLPERHAVFAFPGLKLA